MNNCRGNGQGFGGGRHDGGNDCQNRGQGRGHGCNGGHKHGECGGKGSGQGIGKKRELFLNKYNEYLKTIDLPEFDTDEKYQEWVLNTDEGKLHSDNVKKINDEVDAQFPWGGKRQNAGRRKECVRKVPYTRRISPELLENLKNYAKKHNITETEALERALSKL